MVVYVTWTQPKTGMGNLRTKCGMLEHFDMARIRIFITKLEYKILPKRSSMTSKCLQSRLSQEKSLFLIVRI